VSPDHGEGIARIEEWPMPTPEVMRLLERGPAWSPVVADEQDSDDHGA